MKAHKNRIKRYHKKRDNDPKPAYPSIFTFPLLRVSARKKVASLKQGDYFGENALLRNEPRSATIKAITEIKTLKIIQEKFKDRFQKRWLNYGSV